MCRQPSRSLSHRNLRPWSTQRTVSTTSTQRLGPIAEDPRDPAGAGVGAEQVLLVLQPVQLLDGERAVVLPLEPGQVAVARIARRLHPGRVAAVGRDDADPRRRVGRAGLGIRDLRRHRVDAVGVVDQREDADARGVELPVGDAAAVGAPAEAVADAELLLVDPVGGAVDDRLRAGGRQPRDPAVGQPLDVQVVGADVGHARGIG